MPDPNDWLPRVDLLLIAAFTAAILLLDYATGLRGEHVPIVAAILIPLFEGLRRRFGAEEHGC